jgi:polyisoprenoid-binding protein YceI
MPDMVAQMPRVAGPRRAWTEFGLLACVSLLAGCSAQRAELPPSAPSPSPAEAARPLEIPAGAAVYAIDPEHSVVTLRVYRAGPLARLGHNHVVTSTVEAGYAWTTGELAGSGFEVHVPVADLLVDDPAARVAAGPDFPGEVPDDAREGTRRNMLRPEVLDGERYPEIVVAAASLGGSWDRPVVTARVTLKDRTRAVTVPLSIDRSASELVARGGFRILQSDFGIAPFSVGGGAIQVADSVDVAFEIRAVP